jgi:hypothetical protein
MLGGPLPPAAKATDTSKTDNLLDLLEGLDFSSGPALTAPAANHTAALNNLLGPASSAPAASHNILEGLMSMPSQQPSAVSSNNLDDLFGDLGGPLSPPASAPSMQVPISCIAISAEKFSDNVSYVSNVCGHHKTNFSHKM